MLYYLLMKRVPLTIFIILLLCFYANAQSALDSGTVNDGLYINRGLRFSFKYPKDWVVHGAATNERIRELGKEKIAESGALSRSSVETALQTTYQLLTVFRHPVGTPGITFNPAILVIAEQIAHAPGITNGKDYLLNLRAFLMKAGAQVVLTEPMEHRFAGSQFFRDDYAVVNNEVQVAQAYFVTVTKGYALVFVFTGQDQNSVEEMSKAMETFALAPPERKGAAKTAPRRKSK